MTFKELVQELCRREGGKRGVNIADMSEIVKCLAEIVKEESEQYTMKFEHTVKGWKLSKPKRRAKRKGKK